jgi:hypothetical protein
MGMSDANPFAGAFVYCLARIYKSITSQELLLTHQQPFELSDTNRPCPHPTFRP